MKTPPKNYPNAYHICGAWYNCVHTMMAKKKSDGWLIVPLLVPFGGISTSFGLAMSIFGSTLSCQNTNHDPTKLA